MTAKQKVRYWRHGLVRPEHKTLQVKHNFVLAVTDDAIPGEGVRTAGTPADQTPRDMVCGPG